MAEKFTKKKPLNVDGIVTGAEDKVVTLGVSSYPNGNLKLILEVNGKPFKELSADIESVLQLNNVAISPEVASWVRYLIYQNNLGDFLDIYYLNAQDIRDRCTIYDLNRFALSDFAKEEYEQYVYERAKNPVKGLDQYQLWRRRDRYRTWIANQHKNACSNGRKPRYKSRFFDLYDQKAYRHKRDLIMVTLPKGTKAEIERYGEKATDVLKRKLYEYLDEHEKKGEQ